MFSKSNELLFKILPKPVVKILSRKILKQYLNKYANIEIMGQENLKNLKKPTIFISNHLSNSDALVLNHLLKDQDLTFVAGIKLSENPITNIGILIIKTTPIKPNSPDKDGIKKIISIIKDGNNVLLFPEGTRSRTGGMIEAKKGILLIAKLTKAEIVPVGIWGTEKLLPIDKKDMAAEHFHYADVKTRIGKPFSLPDKEKDEDRKDYEERAMTFIMKNISNLLPESYKGFYK
ncbi:MAG: 1-acyl-sn-glycerol-3-phosphate acyltransferase [Bacillota bacterium]|nr:1-acyl-sn-glycerol-3-phosphate acyltransferase [Bacillota bacterium]